MKKRYDPPQKPETGTGEYDDNPYMVNEASAAPYGMETEMTYSPPLTEEEEKELITREELMEAVFAHIDELFDGKK